MKFLNRKKKLNAKIVLLMMLYINPLWAQDTKLITVIPPSPNTAALGKYGDIPIGLYTGIPNISIPIYEIKDKDLSLPISLSYYAGGVKVEEIPSSVGLGWTLNAGGVVGRLVRGLPDEFGSWQPQPLNNTVESIAASGNVAQLAKDVAEGHRDGEADLYYYNFSGLSGKFFYDQSGSIHTYPLKNILITPVSGGGWKIVTEDGSVYTFGKQEDISSSGCSEGEDQIIPTAWYLTSIKSSDGKREITFSYESVWIVSTTLLSQKKYFLLSGTGSCMPQPSPCIGTNQARTHRLTRIDFGDGYLKFNYNNVRCDLVDDKSLDNIGIYSKANVLIKKFNLQYNYFGNNNDGVNRNTENNKRLKLISLTEQGSSAVKPPYVFEYDESISLPSRLSFAQDHWGYYNGKNNSDLISSFTTTNFSSTPIFFAGADRNADPTKTQAGILKKIKYPTGGETAFTYENNTVSDDRVEYDVTTQVISLVSPGYLVSDLPTPFESELITIPTSGATVHYSISGLDSWPWQGCDIVQCQVIKDNNYSTPFRTLQNGLNGTIDNWPAGTYKLKFFAECGYGTTANFTAMVTAEIPIPETFTIRTVGGLRIKQIENKSGIGDPPIVKKYRYHPENDPAHSSGFLVNFPDYGNDLSVLSYYKDQTDTYIEQQYECVYRVRQSVSNYPLATTQGSYVGYSHVIEDLGNDGESRHSFVAYENFVGGPFPFAPTESFDWRRGFELAAKYYKIKNGQFTLVKEVINTPYNNNTYSLSGIKAGRNSIILKDGSLDPSLQHAPVYAIYPTKTEFYSIASTREIDYDENDASKYTEKTIDYVYSPQHLQLTQVKTNTSISTQTIKDETIVCKKYAFDYTFTGAPSGSESMGIKTLQNLHIPSAVVEEYVIRQNRNGLNNEVTNQRVIRSNINVFKSDLPCIDKVLRLEANSPVLLSNFGAGSALSANAFVYNVNPTINSSYQPRIYFDSYDSYGNILQQHKSDDIHEVYLWGYNAQYPVAKIVGSDYATAIALVNPTLLNNANGQYTDAQMRTELNKLRTGIPNAQVWTYTYAPLKGTTSETDPKGYLSYYEYDDFGRLQDIKDADGNIIKTFEYNYKQ